MEIIIIVLPNFWSRLVMYPLDALDTQCSLMASFIAYSVRIGINILIDQQDAILIQLLTLISFSTHSLIFKLMCIIMLIVVTLLPIFSIKWYIKYCLWACGLRYYGWDIKLVGAPTGRVITISVLCVFVTHICISISAHEWSG